MFSEYSYQSKVSIKSQNIVDQASRSGKFQAPPTLDGLIDDEVISNIWGSFGLYISRQMRMGRGIQIPNFGIFTFSAPSVQLDGVTNPNIRDKQLRLPVFLVSKEFTRGKVLKSGIYMGNHIRPYNVQTSGSIQQAKINFAEISYISGQNKETTKYSIERMIRVLADKTRQNESVDMELPGVGVFQVRNSMVAVKFQESFINNTKAMPKRPLSERKDKGNMGLTAETLGILNYQNTLKNNLPIQIDESGKRYLKQKYEFDLQSRSSFRPSTAGNSRYGSQSIKSLSQMNTPNNQKSKQLLRPQTGKATNAPQKPLLNSFTKNLSNLQYSMKRLKFWIRQNWFRSEDAFLEVCNQAFGRTSEQKIKLSLENFKIASEKMDLMLNDEQLQELFEHLDVNKDGFINFKDWYSIIKDDNQHVNYIKDVIYKRQLHSDDVLKTLGLDRESEPVGIEKLTKGLKNMDQMLNLPKARIVASAILNGQKTISMQSLIELLECVEEEDKTFNPSWFKDILYKIKYRLLASGSYISLRKVFEKYDETNIGSLDTANFKTVLIESNLNLEVKDINRVVRYLPKVGSNRIDYYNFLKLVERIDITATSNDMISDTTDFSEKLGNFIKSKNLDILQFLKTIRSWVLQNGDSVSESGDISTQQFSEYMKLFAFQRTPKADLDNFVEELDLDSDGYIKQNDVQTFLTKYKYFDQIFSAPNQSTRNLQVSKTAFSKSINLNTKTLFPQEPLDEDKVDQVLIDIRKKLDLKKLGLVQFFNLLDSDQDGFITIQEFSQNIEKILPLSQRIKDGFFAFMDKQHIGIIDLSTFIKTMQKSVVRPMPKIQEDNFDWEINMMLKIRDWFFMEKLTVEDAFRTIDQQYKGFIKVDDLEQFLKGQLKVKNEEINQGKINRLFKLMDVYKRGRITVDDLRRFLCEDFSHGQNNTIMGNQSIDNYSSFDWKLNARQQLGIVITRRFKNLTHSFDIISGYKKQLIFPQFAAWVEKNIALRGFDLSVKLLQELFSDLDPHKKGYLTESDWENIFGGYNWKNQVFKEVQEMINRNFDSLQKAYQFFCQGNELHIINFKNFKQSINYLFPRRFIESDILDMWLQISNGQKTIDQNLFEQAFNKGKQSYLESYVDIQQRPLSTMGTTTVDGKNLKDVIDMGGTTYQPPFSKENLLDRIRRFLRSCNQDPKQHLEAADYNQTGLLTNLEFRNAMKKLNFALSVDEVDLLINLCGAEGNINWKQFLKIIELRETDNKILDRSKVRLAHISELVYTYMLSPKDAFRKFDVDKDHSLDFTQFQDFIKEIYFLANQEMPPYSIIKDMFEYIDKRRDGIIDMTEWMDVFQQFEYQPKASVLKNTRPQQNNLYSVFNQKKLSNKQDRPQTAMITNKKKPKNSMNKSSENFFVKQQQEDSNYIRRPVTAINNLNQDEVLKRTFKFEAPQEKFEQVRLGQWESSKDFDKILTAIGRNRKFLLDIFSSYDRINRPITYVLARDVIEKMLRNGGVEVKESGWPVLLKFAERDGIIDYKFMLDVYKDRIKAIDTHPRK